jgi:hypothetical protein
MLAISPFVSQGMGLRNSTKTEDPLAVLTALLAAGKITPVIDRTYPLSETQEAMRYLEEGQAQGKIVLTMERARAARRSAFPSPCPCPRPRPLARWRARHPQPSEWPRSR